MEKLSNLLDETTIINLRLLWKLVGRYRSHLFIAGLSFLTLFVYYYFSQPIIYSLKIPIKTVASHTVSNDLSALLPVENTSYLTLNELSVSMASYSFIKNFSDLISDESNFEKFNFGSIVNGQNYYGKDIKKKCKKDKGCMAELIFGPLGGSFSLEQGPTENRYILSVSALDELTVLAISDNIVKAIEKNRIQVRQYLVVKEMDSVTNLIKESRSIILKLNGFKILEENEKEQAVIIDLKERVRLLQVTINSESSKLFALEARLLESKKSTKDGFKVDKLMRLRHISIQNKIDDLRQNIAILTNTAEQGRSSSDLMVIDNLNMELTKLEKKLSGLGSISINTSSEAFGKDQENHERSAEFEFLVTKNNIKMTQVEYELEKKRLDELNAGKISKESVVNKLKIDLDFLKNLEAKQLSLKLLNTTMSSDLLFEDFGKEAREYRRSTMVKILLFCFFLSFFIYMMSVIIRYFADDKIYSEDDLKAYFTNLDFIGEVPSFDS